MPNTVIKGYQLLASNGAPNALKFCQMKGFPYLVTYVEQPFAGAIWRDGTVDFNGVGCSQQPLGCPAYLYIMCAATPSVSASAAYDSNGNIGYGVSGHKVASIGNLLGVACLLASAHWLPRHLHLPLSLFYPPEHWLQQHWQLQLWYWQHCEHEFAWVCKWVCMCRCLVSAL